MQTIIRRSRPVIALLFAISLLFAPFSEGDSYRNPGCADSAKSTVIDTGVFRPPFLPAGEAEIEKLVTSIFQHGLPARKTLKTASFAFREPAAIAALTPSAFLILSRRILYEGTDQFQRSLIKYIHDKEDHK